MEIPRYAFAAANQFFTTGAIVGGSAVQLSPEEAAETQDQYLAALEDCRVLDESAADHAKGQPNLLVLKELDEDVVTEFALTGPGTGTAQTALAPSQNLYQHIEVTDDTVRSFRAAREGDSTLFVAEVVDRRTMTGQRIVLETSDGFLLSA